MDRVYARIETETDLSAAARLLARRAGIAGRILGRAFRYRRSSAKPKEALAHFPKALDRCAIIGEDIAAVGDAKPNNPQAVLDYLHYQRAYKTDYELRMMRVASKLGARAHRAAEAAFRAGKSEYDIHMAYLQSVHETDNELPYSNIIAINQHGAVLHYTDLNRAPPAHADSFLIDAGASFHGYAADITRTYAGAHAGEFKELIDSVDEAQRGFVDKVRAKQSYPELHIHAHHVLAEILRKHDFIRMSAESAVESRRVVDVFPARPRPSARTAGARHRRIPEIRRRRHARQTERSSVSAADARRSNRAW